MVLLRRVLGDALRERRLAQSRTLRDVSTEAKVSLGYLSELERGQKEASSELLSSICDALGAQLSEVLRDVSDTMALSEEMAELANAPATVPAAPAEAQPQASGMTVTDSVAPVGGLRAPELVLHRTVRSAPREVVCAA
jgi:XRE family transcriptional regulator, stress-response regulator